MQNAAVQGLKRSAARLSQCIVAYERIEARLPLESIINRHPGDHEPYCYYGSTFAEGENVSDVSCTFQLSLPFNAITSGHLSGLFSDSTPQVFCRVIYQRGILSSEMADIVFDHEGWTGTLSSRNAHTAAEHCRKLSDICKLKDGERHRLDDEEALALMSALADFYLALKKEVEAKKAAP